MDLGLRVLLIANIIISLAVTIGSFWYFQVVKSKYRWIKLFWGLEMLVYVIILIWTIFGGTPTAYTQYIALLLPTTCLLYGLVSAFSRKKEMDYITILEAKLNGDMQNWIQEQLTKLPDKRGKQ